MPTSETFNWAYFANPSSSMPDANTTYGARQDGPTTLADLEDGNEDGSTEVGENLRWDAAAVQLVGFTSNGDPVITFVGSYWIMSDDPDLSGNIGFTTTGSYPYCFLEGCAIAAESGEIAVEDLKIGDLIVNHEGQSIPVKWIGRQTVSTRFGRPERRMPVRFKAGALGGGLPKRDLTVTADHALLIDGLLINAGALVNGSSIDFVPLSEFDGSYTVYHIETENHDVILAEGAPAETYIDYAARRAFDNHAEYLALYGEDRTIPEVAYPRISSARQLPPVLAARFGAFRAA